MKLSLETPNSANTSTIAQPNQQSIAQGVLKYVPSVAINTGMCAWLKPYQGGVMGIVTLGLLYLAQGIKTLKAKQYDKFIDLTIRYGITVSIFYIIPYAILFFL